MVDITPFRGLLYNQDKVGNISKVISPPYDIISPALKKELYSSHPYNIINLILPEGRGDHKYSRAKEILDDWIDEDILIPDCDSCFFIIEESFFMNGKIKKISGFIGLTKIEPYSESNILPHEKTSSTVKKDRLKLLSACRMNFDFIYTLYNDSQSKIKKILKSNTQKKPEIDIKAGYDPNLGFKLWKIKDSNDINEIIRIMKDKKIILADGHHRYETSLAYKNELDRLRNKSDKNKLNPEDFILTLFVESSQDDLVVLPTHRMLKFKNYPGSDKIIETINDFFQIKKYPLKSTRHLNEKLSKSKSRGLKSFFVYFGAEKMYFITLKSNFLNTATGAKQLDSDYLNMDINLLHKFFIEKISDSFEIKKISYTHSEDELIESVDSQKSDVGILLAAPTVKEIEKICMANKLMPEKSTYFYPKPCSGLVMYKFDNNGLQY